MAKPKPKVKAERAFTKTKQTMTRRNAMRWSDDLWNAIQADVAADKTKQLTFSDVVRQIVSAHYTATKKPR
jgi:hypothetical protein